MSVLNLLPYRADLAVRAFDLRKDSVFARY